MKKSSICLCSKVESLARDDVHQSPGKQTSPRSRHSACCLPKQLVLYYHDVELLQLEQERKPARMSVKTYFLLFHTLAIDRLSHVSQEREPTISQFLQNVSVRPKLWLTTVQPHLDWVRFRPSETSFNMAAAAETKWRWDLHMVNWFCLRKKGSTTKKSTKEKENGDCGPPTRKVSLWDFVGLEPSGT